MEWGVAKNQSSSCEISVVYSSRTPRMLPLLQRVAQNVLNHLTRVFDADALPDAGFDCVLLAGGLDANVGFAERFTADALFRSPSVAHGGGHHLGFGAAFGTRRLAASLPLRDAEPHDQLDPRRRGRGVLRRTSSS